MSVTQGNEKERQTVLCVRLKIFAFIFSFYREHNIYWHSHVDAICTGQLKPVHLILQTCHTEWLCRIKWYWDLYTHSPTLFNYQENERKTGNLLVLFLFFFEKVENYHNILLVKRHTLVLWLCKTTTTHNHVYCSSHGMYMSVRHALVHACLLCAWQTYQP